MHFGMEPGTSISLAHSRGISPKPIPRAAVAGNVDVRSRVVVNMTLTTSSWANSLRSISAAQQLLGGVFDRGGRVVVTRRGAAKARNCADLMLAS